MKSISPFLTTSEAAEFLLFKTVGAFRSFLFRRRGAGFPVTTHRRGATLLFKQSDLESALTVERSRLRRPG